MRKYILPVSWMILIFAMSSVPGSKFPPMFPGFDKIVHVSEYAVLGFFWMRALPGRFLLVMLICVGFGLSDEVHQLFVPLREFSLLDLAADAVGAVKGAICQLLLRKFRLAR